MKRAALALLALTYCGPVDAAEMCPAGQVAVQLCATPVAAAPAPQPPPPPKPEPPAPPPPEPSPPTASSVLLFEGFEKGDRGAFTGNTGTASYPSSDCRSGSRCGSMRVSAGATQSSVHWWRDFGQHNPSVFYMSAWWKFPADWTWDGAQSHGVSFDHKLFILNQVGNEGRLIVSLYNKDGQISSSVGGTLPDRRYFSDLRMPRDGQWHRVEIEARRTEGRVRVWLDGRLALDFSKPLCGAGGCRPLGQLEVGAYINQGAPVTQSFGLDDVEYRAGPRPGS